VTVQLGDTVELLFTADDNVAGDFFCNTLTGRPDFALVPSVGPPVQKSSSGETRCHGETVKTSTVQWETRVGFRAIAPGSVRCRNHNSACDMSLVARPPDGGPCAPIANFAGLWHSNYTCWLGDDGGIYKEGQFDLTITQTGDQASYVDGDLKFSGTVCGSVWAFRAMSDKEIEQGTLTLIDATHATRESHWWTGASSGGCHDDLTR
jgi:hypothetical protein